MNRCHSNACESFPRHPTVTFRLSALSALSALLAMIPPSAVAADGELLSDPPVFSTHVMAVLSRAGCNQGACHGNLNGKGGLKLSLRGEDSQWDYRVLVRDQGGRRVDVVDPASSLVLSKATGKVPHQGGVRFGGDSLEYAILRDWMHAGCPPTPDSAIYPVRLEVQPADSVVFAPVAHLALQATAHFNDGSRHDVTRLAAYETSSLIARVDADGVVRAGESGETTILVRYLNQQAAVRVAFVPARPDAGTSEPPRGRVDRWLAERWRALRSTPAPPADDATLARRVYLDLLGVPPTADEARDFVDSPDVDKFERLTDQLLARPEFADRWALVWSDLLRVEEKVLDATGVDRFHGWIRESVARGVPLDQFVSQLIVARGSTYEHPPANYYRALRDPFARGETTARLFLGVRLQCAQCHNHPFDRWTQDDYYSWAALFGRIDYQIVANNRKDKFDKHEFDGEQIVQVKDEGEVKNARTGANAIPRFLGASEPATDSAGDPKADRLAPLAQWLTGKGNFPFARTQVNLVWYQLMGRGLVEPIDDLRPTNPPSHPELLEDLARDFAEWEFDLRRLARTIVTSRAYRLSSQTNDTIVDDALFARAIVRRLPAETLLDAQSLALGVSPSFTGYDEGTRAGQIAGVRRFRERDRKSSEGDRFLATFGKPPRLLACACERSDETTLKQAFVLLSGGDLQARLESRENRLSSWASDLSAGSVTSSVVVERLFWTILNRPPTAEEATTAAAMLDAPSDRFRTLQDLAWALLNTKEFLFRH